MTAMTAFALRKDLAVDHGLELRGLGYAALVLIHQDDHRSDDLGHTHDPGHADLNQLLYLVVLLVVILILLRLLGVAIR